MTRYGMIIDNTRCTGCYNCFLSCRDEFAGNDNGGYAAAQPMSGMNWIKVNERERGRYPKVKVSYTLVMCMHCDDAGCVRAARDHAVYRRPDGIVIIDPVKAKGQQEIVAGCPYRVIEWNEEKQIPQKCIFCAHLIDKGEQVPRCVEACPTGALVFGDLDDPRSEITKLTASSQTEALHPEYGMKEKVRYIGLPKKFVAGTVVLGDVDEVAVGAKVTLSGNGKEQSTKTNGFGDFEFEGLLDDTGYEVKVEAAGYRPRSVRAKTSRDIYLGEIVLKK